MATKKPKVKLLRAVHKGPMGQDLRNIWTCGVKDDGWYHEHNSRDSAMNCPLRNRTSNPSPVTARKTKSGVVVSATVATLSAAKKLARKMGVR
jgi:hypothetical protein